MTDYSDLLYLICAMVLFSVLSLNTAKKFNTLNQQSHRAEAELRALNIAQSEIDRLQWINTFYVIEPFLPQGYIYKDYPIQVTETYGPNDRYTDTFTVHGHSEFIKDRRGTIVYHITIYVVNTSFSPEIFVFLDYFKTIGY